MMYRFALVVGLGVLWFAAAAQAQSKAEVFGGFQYTRPDGGPNLITGYLNKSFGITADFSGTHGSGLSVDSFTFGPKLTANLPVVKPFVHVLVGAAIPPVSTSCWAAAWMLGPAIGRGASSRPTGR